MTVMDTISSFPFNTDVTDQILTLLPDHNSLLSMVLSSRFAYSVYQSRPNSIDRAIAVNQLGPALPQALRLIRCESANLHRMSVYEIPDDDQIMEQPNVTTEEARKLIRYSKVAHALEDIFSWRHKDRTAKFSQLSVEESLRFQRALYRIWLFSSIYGRECWPTGESFWFDPYGVEAHSITLDEVTNKQRSFFDSFPTLELREIERVNHFLEKIISWSVVANPETQHLKQTDNFFYDPYSRWLDYSLFCGPRAIYQVYAGNVTTWKEFTDIRFKRAWFDGFLRDHIWHIFSLRAMLPIPTTDSAHLLDSVLGQEDQCTQCGTVEGLSLWGENNWPYLRVQMTSDRFIRLLKGLLSQNIYEWEEIVQAYNNTPFATLMSEIFDQKTPLFAKWHREDWLCRTCLEQFMREHLHLWWSHRKRKAGRPTAEDCRHGYYCRLQTDDIDHATNFNHLCKPTRS